MSNVMRVRITQLLAARDLEYFFLRYLRINGVYDVPTSMALDLMDLGVATPSESDALSDFDPVSPDIEEE